MELYAGRIVAFVHKTFHRSVIQIPVGDAKTRRAGDLLVLPLHRESVVLRGYKYLSRRQIPNRVVATPVSVGELDGLSAKSQSEELMAAARMPAQARPARMGGRKVVAVSMKMFSAAALEV